MLVVWATWWMLSVAVLVLGIGPWGEMMSAIPAAEDEIPPDAEIVALFAAMEQTLLLSRVVLWPLAVLAGALFYLWFVRRRSVRHALLIAVPTLELEFFQLHPLDGLWYLLYVGLFVLIVSVTGSGLNRAGFLHVWHAS